MVENKELKDWTNKALLEELGKRIVSNRLEWEGYSAEITKINSNIWDNEWKDTTKPDYTGARTNLVYWIIEAKNKN